MIPIPNMLVGILIGLANDTWLPRLIIPFGWGVIFCIYTAIASRDKQDAFVSQAERRGRKAKGSMSHIQAFYLVEYATATSTSLVFSVIAGAIKAFF
jgi:hypothetical protein